MNMEWTNKVVLVVGAGISGIAAYRLLDTLGAAPVLFDSKTDLDIKAVSDKINRRKECLVYAGVLPRQVEERVEMLVLSPGVPTDTDFVNMFRDRKIPIWGEIELAYHAGRGKLIAITGTNGKTTTTALTGKIAEDYFGHSFVVGNIGNPYTDIALKTEVNSVVVAEISSFQLETIEQFHPQISAILNITPDHMNRHHTMENYIAVKESIAMNQGKDDYCILNYDDEYTNAFAKKTAATPVFFSSRHILENGIYEEDENIMFAHDGKIEKLLNIHEMKLIGQHNVENVMAAIAMAYYFGIPMESILSTVKEFKAVEHRIEFVATKKGVDYYNDSKGTNPDAAIKGIQAMNKPTILIGGGYDKGSTYDEWIDAFDGKVKALVLLGQTADKIADCARKHGFENIYMTVSLKDTVSKCKELASPGDAVLLSPACASWGMFPNYEVRGRMFKDLVNKIEG